MTKAGLDRKLVEKAVLEIKKYSQRNEEKDGREFILPKKPEKLHLGIRIKKPHAEEIIPKLIRLPFPFTVELRPTMCFIGDLEDVSAVNEAISVKKFISEYRRYEAKREICARYDHFLCFDKDLAEVKRAMGTSFFRKGKAPVVVCFENENVRDKVDEILQSTLFRIPAGRMLALNVGFVTQNAEELTKNIVSVFSAAFEIIGGEWEEIEWVGVVFKNIPALRVYNSLKSE
eukprot:GHVN01002802.1.p1 GENE.GHVN01002802.1~~GHVN01002802.1.p1  ORF type:complete len:231 (+),score=35.99 GHVN01002802.1:3-695(+)